MKKVLSLMLTGALAVSTLAGCGSETDKSVAQNITTEGSSNVATTAATGADSGKEDANVPRWEYGKFTASVVDGKIDLSGIGIVIDIPEELKDKADSIAVKGCVTDEFGYASIYWVDPENPKNTSFEIADIEADTNPVNIDELVNKEHGPNKDIIADLGSNGGFNYYAYKNDVWQKDYPEYFDKQVLSNVNKDKKAKYLEFLSYSSKIVENIKFVDFRIPKALGSEDFDSSTLLNFEVKDLDGNTVKVGDYVSAKKVTMINFWGTFCGPCVNEMPHLAELEKEYQKQGFEILGMTCDVYDSDGNYQDDIVNDAQDIIEDTGVTYPVLIASVDIRNYAKLTAYPTTFFVDSKGKLLFSPVVGSHTKEEWKSYIDKALAAAK